MAHEQLYQQIRSLLGARGFPQALTLLDNHLAQHQSDEIAHSLYGTVLLRSGDTAGAMARFRANTEAFPGSFAAYADLAFAAHKVGDLDAAKASFQNAVDLNPAFYQGWVLLSLVAHRTGDFALAAKADAQSEKYDPLDADYKRIQAALRSGGKGEAEHIARTMLQRQPGHPRAAYVLAYLASTVGAHEDRAEILQHAIEHHPANQMLRRSKVEAYEAIGRYTEALSEAKALVEIVPNYFNYWTLSRVHGHLLEHDQAIECVEKARGYLERDSVEHGKLDLLKGHALKILGRREESEAAYRACIENTPGNGAGWWGLADFKNYHFSPSDRDAMQGLIADMSLEADQRCQAAFALAKSYEVDGDMRTAFSHYQRANGLREGINFDTAKHQSYFRRIKDTYSAETLAVQADFQPDNRPIFIVGMPRAGSTLVEQILASHSDVEGTMELMTLPFVERAIRVGKGKTQGKDYPESAALLSIQECNTFGQHYLKDTEVFRTGKPFFVDKLPPNFERVGLIHKLLPGAVIIDVRRHPMDCCFSAFKQHFAAGHDYSYNLENLGSYYNAYLALMAHWDNVLPDRVIRVQYENLVRNTEQEVRRILEAVGLPFEESCVRFHENKRAVRTASSEQVRQPINTKGLKVWTAVEDQLQPLIAALGKETLALCESDFADR